ncbi:UDP-2,3-diacylglucosamine hydrolase [Ventosimonas gracilis]|uniref:UDP-2,3-diacylglucosamine hydrolase n=1 Tax=Ventosimonas gracilis TaxID=1680762 RepID=A0A139SX43_9GAMM|nr:UDP-2,3-diacylglucosamine diphosphatase [Ventosimonas gracilis]KXU39187.1 UDP-2,3-diacylglucosamine hydrolase [Ventosimonas gracilis]
MILLISDLHLEAGRHDITRGFLDFLEQQAVKAKALYILGDFFEVWLGDDDMSPFAKQIAEALHALSQSGTRIFIMHGNRDFLIGEHFCREAGCTLLADPSLIELSGEKVLLMHGDSLCTEDTGYQRLRFCLRNPLSLWLLKHLPLCLRRSLARRLRKTSRHQTQVKAGNITDVTPDEVRRVMQANGVQTLIHGHTHRPATHVLQINHQPAQRIVLGDWDKQGWFLQLDQNGFVQHAFDLPVN